MYGILNQSFVVPGLDPGMHAVPPQPTSGFTARCPATWTAGSSPAMTLSQSNQCAWALPSLDAS